MEAPPDDHRRPVVAKSNASERDSSPCPDRRPYGPVYAWTLSRPVHAGCNGCARARPSAVAGAHSEASQLVRRDYEEHHCVFNVKGKLHNHLNHQLYASYDLGADADLLEAIYKHHEQVKEVIPIDLKGTGIEDEAARIEIVHDEPFEHLGNVAGATSLVSSV